MLRHSPSPSPSLLHRRPRNWSLQRDEVAYHKIDFRLDLLWASFLRRGLITWALFLVRELFVGGPNFFPWTDNRLMLFSRNPRNWSSATQSRRRWRLQEKFPASRRGRRRNGFKITVNKCGFIKAC
jgi:hypothetical protein